MDFDYSEIDKIVAEAPVSDTEKQIIEHTLVLSSEFEKEYGDTSYEVPICCVNLAAFAELLENEQHPALSQRRTKRFTADEFPDLDYGDDDEQPTFATVFAKYLNLVYATTTYAVVAQKVNDGELGMVLTDNGFSYELTEGAEDSDLVQGAIEYASIFL